MTVTSRPLTSRIGISASGWEKFRCAIGLHPWARWERLTATMTTRQGKTKTEQELFVNVRECIPCGISEIKHL
jgi:hypothetical protein